MDTSPDPYAGIGRHYDRHGWDWYAPTYGSRLLALLEESGIGPGASILDAGCGTGTLALLLAEHGYQLTGVDLSPRMIDLARVKDARRVVAWRTGDLRTLSLGTTHDAIVSVADVFNHFPSIGDWEAAFSRLREHLRPDGLLFVDAMTSAGLSRMDQQSVQERAGTTLIVAIVWDPKERRSTLKVTSFAPAAGSEHFERASETIAEWGQRVAEVLERARRAGFARVERVWGSAEDPEADDRLTIVARR